MAKPSCEGGAGIIHFKGVQMHHVMQKQREARRKIIRRSTGSEG